MITAIIICSLLLLAYFALYGWLTSMSKTEPYQARHGFTDPADTTDPDGEQYVARLRDTSEPDEADGKNVPDVWDEDEIDAGWQHQDDEHEDTRTDLHAATVWGGNAQQKAEELASKYLTAEVTQ